MSYTFICRNCGKEFKRGEANSLKIDMGTTLRFCSYKCCGKWFLEVSSYMGEK